MKKILAILAVTVVALALVSCNKEKQSGGSFLPGTSWETLSGLEATFDNSHMYITGAAGTAVGTYTVTSEVSGISTFFNVENLTYDGKTYTTGSAYPSYKMMVLFEKGGLSELNFIQK